MAIVQKLLWYAPQNGSDIATDIKLDSQLGFERDHHDLDFDMKSKILK